MFKLPKTFLFDISSLLENGRLANIQGSLVFGLMRKLNFRLYKFPFSLRMASKLCVNSTSLIQSSCGGDEQIET